jgi:hypothetical protein
MGESESRGGDRVPEGTLQRRRRSLLDHLMYVVIAAVIYVIASVCWSLVTNQPHQDTKLPPDFGWWHKVPP